MGLRLDPKKSGHLHPTEHNIASGGGGDAGDTCRYISYIYFAAKCDMVLPFSSLTCSLIS